MCLCLGFAGVVDILSGVGERSSTVYLGMVTRGAIVSSIIFHARRMSSWVRRQKNRSETYKTMQLHITIELTL
jgi:hypothetical protein